MKSLKLKDNMIICHKDGKEEKVEVGSGCTICYYSDRVPATIIAISTNEKTITVQEDKWTRTDNNGMSDCQEYTYERDFNGSIHTFKRTRKDKSVYTDNGKSDDWGTFLIFGVRRRYYDYSF